VLKFLHWRKKAPRVALALGAGGARGLAHIPVLEALDELGVTPVAIAGASMGAVIGASYASGMSGKDIRAFALDTLRGRGGIARRLVSHQLGRMRAHLREKRSFGARPCASMRPRSRSIFCRRISRKLSRICGFR
jgi:predicted acylesterase/phospholipase RssA